MYRKIKQISELKKDDIVNDIFVVKFKKPVEPYKNGYRFELRLGDASKEIMYKYWGPDDEAAVEALYESINKDDVVAVQGRVNEWNEKLEISANENNTIIPLKEGEYDVKDFIKKSNKDPELMWRDLKLYIDSITNPELKNLINYFFADPEFVAKFKECPAAMYIHHGWIHGLLEHTLSVVRTVDFIQKIQVTLDRDLVIAGALLHDIGKMKEFEMTTSIKVSTQGMLVGHVTIATEMISRAVEELGINPELGMKVLHIILTHMGDYGSSKTPSIPEALAVYYADQTDAQLTHMISLKEEAQTDDDYIYNKDFGNIYLK